MNDTSPRCAGPGSACRLVQLETPGARPVWAILDAAGLRRFTGELTLASRPVVRAYFSDGEVYYAEREGDPSIGERLVEYGVVTTEQLAAGTVTLGPVCHLGRLFDRVPAIERDAVELVLELVTGEVLGEIADHTVDGITIASYRHHSSGVSKWRRQPSGAVTDDVMKTGEITVIAPQPLLMPPTLENPVLAAPVPHLPGVVDSDEPSEADHQLVAEYEQLMSLGAPANLVAGEPTEQLVVPEALLILEAPPRLSPPPQPFAAPQSAADPNPAPEPALAVELAPILELAPVLDQTLVSDPPVDEPAPFSFEFDLDEVLAQVMRENDGLPLPTEAGEVDESVRAAVREALAEIEAATRPAVASGLSATSFEIALDSAPDSPADIEPTGTAAPFLPQRSVSVPAVDHEPADIADPVPSSSDTPDTGLRRLIGGTRKP